MDKSDRRGEQEDLVRAEVISELDQAKALAKSLNIDDVRSG
jgi:hypothetical protein